LPSRACNISRSAPRSLAISTSRTVSASIMARPSSSGPIAQAKATERPSAAASASIGTPHASARPF
jgi:hypothetical protein